MTAQTVFLYPANVAYTFLLSLLGIHGLGVGVDLLLSVAIAIIFWAKVFHIISAVIRRIFGFDRG